LNAGVRANDPELVKIFIDHTPPGRAGKPRTSWGPAIFLTSDLSNYVTGSTVMADGGYRVI
jgi:3-oxoacyl-[acyl-carrier protein] reductase